jgi:hypothetical protein
VLSAWEAGHLRLAAVGVILVGLMAWAAVGALSGNLALSQLFTLVPATAGGAVLMVKARRSEQRQSDNL